MKRAAQKGFTLIELLVVIGILAILFAIVLIAINPARQFNQANDTKRRSDTLQILNAIHQYVAENSGNLPAGLTANSSGTITDSGIDVCSILMPTYISAFPADPAVANGAPITACNTGAGESYNSGYYVAVDSSGRVTVSAPNAALGTVSVTR